MVNLSPTIWTSHRLGAVLGVIVSASFARFLIHTKGTVQRLFYFVLFTITMDHTNDLEPLKSFFMWEESKLEAQEEDEDHDHSEGLALALLVLAGAEIGWQHQATQQADTRQYLK